MSEFFAALAGLIVGGIINYAFLRHQLEFKDRREDKSLRIAQYQQIAEEIGRFQALMTSAANSLSLAARFDSREKQMESEQKLEEFYGTVHKLSGSSRRIRSLCILYVPEIADSVFAAGDRFYLAYNAFTSGRSSEDEFFESRADIQEDLDSILIALGRLSQAEIGIDPELQSMQGAD